MKLVDFTVEVRFKNKAKLIQNDLRLSLAKKIAPPKEQPKQPDTIQGIQLNLKDKRTAIVAQEDRYAVTVQIKNDKEASKQIISYIKTINDTVNYSDLQIARVGVRTIWLQKYDSTLDELKAKFKDKFYVNNKITKSAIDYSANLTLKQDKFSINYLAGPVGKNEPLPNIIFPLSNLNDANVYVSLDCFTLDNGVLSLAELNKLVNSAFSLGENKAKETLEVLEITQ